MSLGFMIGPIVMMAIVGDGSRSDVNLAFLAGGICIAAASALMELSFAMIDRHPAMRLLNRSKREIEMIVQTKADDEAEWIDSMCESLRTQLTKGDPNYRNWDGFHGNVQRMLARAMNDWLPTLPLIEGEGAERGSAHFEPMFEWMHKHATDEETLTFHQLVPHVPALGFGEHMLDPLHSGGLIHDATGHTLRERVLQKQKSRMQVVPSGESGEGRRKQESQETQV
jgi:hypothetical protein